MWDTPVDSLSFFFSPVNTSLKKTRLHTEYRKNILWPDRQNSTTNAKSRGQVAPFYSVRVWERLNASREWKDESVWIIHPFRPCSRPDYTPLNSYLHPFMWAYSSQALTTAAGEPSPALLSHIACDGFPGCPVIFSKRRRFLTHNLSVSVTYSQRPSLRWFYRKDSYITLLWTAMAQNPGINIPILDISCLEWWSVFVSAAVQAWNCTTVKLNYHNRLPSYCFIEKVPWVAFTATGHRTEAICNLQGSTVTFFFSRNDWLTGKLN